MSDVERWLTEVGTAALVGTARREPPFPPPVLGVAAPADEVPVEHRLLASAAVAAALIRAGAPLAEPDAATSSAPPETIPQCGEAAAQLLHLLLSQPPVSRTSRDELVVEWLRLAAGAGQRVPWWLLPTLLDFAAGRRHVARHLGPALGERGTWLVGLNPAWSGLLSGEAELVGIGPDWVETWPMLPSAEAVAVFGVGRAAEPVAARELLESQWDRLPAKVRAECLQALRHGLSSDDEPLLERALDDKATSVRDAAARVLDRLPESARAARMAARLRSLVRLRGTLVRHLEVDVPEPPDEAGIRDGLRPSTKGADVAPTEWLARIVRSAPLTTWTDLTGRPPAATLRMIRDKDVLAWLVEVVLERRDREWALACVDHGVTDPRLLPMLPDDVRTRLLVSWVARPPAGRELPALLTAAPRPWPEELATAVLGSIRRQGSGSTLASAAGPLLTGALAPSSAPEVRATLAELPEEATQLRRALTETLQLHAFRTSLTEAFR